MVNPKSPQRLVALLVLWAQEPATTGAVDRSDLAYQADLACRADQPGQPGQADPGDRSDRYARAEPLECGTAAAAFDQAPRSTQRVESGSRAAALKSFAELDR